MTALSAYIPQDRLRALAAGESLPDRTTGSALFADISGFTPLNESLHNAFGPRRGTEKLTHYLDMVYTALIAEVEKQGGSVIGFAGDSITCWFDEAEGPTPPRAVTCALALQQAMLPFTHITLPDSSIPALGLKVSVATGPARRFVVGNPDIHYLDTLAGATVTRMATAEHLAQKGEIVVDEATVVALGTDAIVQAWRIDSENKGRFAVISRFVAAVPALEQSESTPALEGTVLRSWHHQAVYEREKVGQGAFLTEFRPTVALFVRFMGIDYDAEGAHAHLDRFIWQTQLIINRYKGTIIHLTIGDKGSYLSINFGALRVHEDDARRAVKTAWEIQLAAANFPFLSSLQMGITQGVMRVGAYGGPTRRTYGTMGDEVNLSARLMSAAAPGEILVSGHVQKATADHFTFEPRPPLPMKGKAEPLPVFAVTGESQHRAIRLQEPTYALPMVGRDAELKLINDKLDCALAGKAQVVGVVAEAGLGKSRLVAEAIRSARRKGFVGYGGACQSDGVNTPYLVWKPIFAAFFDVDPSAPLRKQLRNLEGEIEDRVPERVQALPLLTPLLNLEIPDNDFTRTLEPKYRQSALHVLLEECLRAAAKEEPVLIVIEDLHWLDTLSHTLLEELARALHDSHICFLLAYRPPHLERLQIPRLESLAQFTKIFLQELNTREAEQVIRAKLAQLYPARSGAVPPSLVDKLMARSQGNPFFLEELLNYLHDRGLDPRDPVALEKIELPDSLHTLILSRLDQLSEHEKTTLRVASIIGRLFRAPWLTGYYPELGDLPRVKHDLERLDELEITPLDSEPELAYLFKHIVTHEVTYESLPFVTRSKLHEQLARYLEAQIANDSLVESFWLDTLVYHYTHSENHDKQRVYLRKAGQMAFNVSAFPTAVEYLTRLLELTPQDDPERSALALQLAEAYFRMSDFVNAQAVIEMAHAAANDDIGRIIAQALLAELLSTTGKHNEAHQILTEIVPLARASGDQPTLCRALTALGLSEWNLGNLNEARDVLEESVTLAREIGDVTRELAALFRLGTVSAALDEPVRAEQLLREVHTRAVATGNRERAMAAITNLGSVADGWGNKAAARGNYQQAIMLAREIGVQHFVALNLLNLATIDIPLGELDLAREELRQGLSLALRIGSTIWVVTAVQVFADLIYAEGQTERALALLGLASRHSAWSSMNQRQLKRTLTEWAIEPAVVEAGMARGADLDWDKTIDELLQE